MAEKYSRRLFFFTLIFTPLAFGTVEPWSYAVLESVAVAALFLYFIHAARTNGPVYKVPGLVWLTLFLALILVQTVPLPASLVGLISPGSFEIQQKAAIATGADAWMTLSVHPRATVQAFFRYAAYAAFYILSVQLLTRKDLLKKTVFVITIFAAALAFSSILQLYLTENRALWFRHISLPSSIMGPYINRNHYAGFMEMIFPVVLALFFFYRPRLGQGSLIKDILEIFGREKGNIHILIGTAAILIAVSIFLSLSRGAIISTCLAFFLFTFLLSRRRIAKGGTMLTATVLILACLSATWFGWEPIFERFGSLKNELGGGQFSRIDYWRDTCALISDYPVVGTGMGTFADSFRLYQSSGFDRFVDHCHNDYLELTAESGIIGLLLMVGFVASVLTRTYRTYRRRRESYAIYICIGSVTGIIALLFHSLMEFNLQIGANGLWFFFLLALAVSAAHTRIKAGGDTSLLKIRKLSVGSRWAEVAGVGVFLVLAVLFNISSVLGNFYYGHVRNLDLRLGMPAASLEKIERIAGMAVMFDPLNAKYAFAKADVDWLLSDHEEAETGFVSAIGKNPVKAIYYKRYGMFLAQSGQRKKAAQMLKRSIAYDPVNPDNALEYGALLVSMQREEEGFRFLKKAVELDEAAIEPVLTILGTMGFSPAEAAAVVPDLPRAVLGYAEFLRDMGQTVAAAEKYEQALELMEQGNPFKKKHVVRVYQFFLKQGSIRQAMDILLRAEVLLPDDANIRILLGDLYQQQGIFYKAEEKYRAALVIDPNNQRAKKRLNP